MAKAVHIRSLSQKHAHPHIESRGSTPQMERGCSGVEIDLKQSSFILELLTQNPSTQWSPSSSTWTPTYLALISTASHKKQTSPHAIQNRNDNSIINVLLSVVAIESFHSYSCDLKTHLISRQISKRNFGPEESFGHSFKSINMIYEPDEPLPSPVSRMISRARELVASQYPPLPSQDSQSITPGSRNTDATSLTPSLNEVAHMGGWAYPTGHGAGHTLPEYPLPNGITSVGESNYATGGTRPLLNGGGGGAIATHPILNQVTYSGDANYVAGTGAGSSLKACDGSDSQAGEFDNEYRFGYMDGYASVTGACVVPDEISDIMSYQSGWAAGFAESFNTLALPGNVFQDPDTGGYLAATTTGSLNHQQQAFSHSDFSTSYYPDLDSSMLMPNGGTELAHAAAEEFPFRVGLPGPSGIVGRAEMTSTSGNSLIDTDLLERGEEYEERLRLEVSVPHTIHNGFVQMPTPNSTAYSMTPAQDNMDSPALANHQVQAQVPAPTSTAYSMSPDHYNMDSLVLATHDDPTNHGQAQVHIPSSNGYDMNPAPMASSALVQQSVSSQDTSGALRVKPKKNTPVRYVPYVGPDGETRPTEPGNRKLLKHELKLLESFYLIIEPLNAPMRGHRQLESWCWSWSIVKYNSTIHNEWCVYLVANSTAEEEAMVGESHKEHERAKANWKKDFAAYRALRRKEKKKEKSGKA
ncbi:uncharacterized protein LY89DRAFT_676827 [Mollisia scopiformis]|uniref:Uncharacterized protein n=1 Tax=Mollisia scopiformis TaxID=149040 RepID=A0A132B9R0_MOLSC|nr:uncharacterized protein LY89DRAFT_676827 [Mollisia scopiformis]KUJ08407.1 hypothetical protein LY89DRAFT_676827 [Mollisia scopiformis]